MRLGIDVGGTHTDAVLFDNGQCVASAKVVTEHDHLIASVRGVLREILKDIKPEQVSILNLSTTLCTNAIVEKKLERVGMLVCGGPGLGPDRFALGSDFHVLQGAIDHRGVETAPLQQDEVSQAVNACRSEGIRVFGAVSKFSPRNPVHEEALRAAVQDQADFVTQGHAISGNLNFPRRIATTYFNCAVWRRYNQFLNAVLEVLGEFRLDCRVNAVKADGGTHPLELSRGMPIESIFSGPSASIMGIMALSPIAEDAIVLDVGGTTTDIAVFATGIPLLEPDGISIDEHPTLIRALKARSIGIGGDSALQRVGGLLTVGPERFGPSMAAGGAVPTLTDALNVLGLTSFLDTGASARGIASIALPGQPPEEVAREALSLATARICEETKTFIREINQQPVYTLLELLEGVEITPGRLIVMGGPAQALSDPLEDCFGLPVEVPLFYDRANAVGAALTKTTMTVELHADTSVGRMFVPTTGMVKSTPRRYSLQEAVAEAKDILLLRLKELDIRIDPKDIQVTQASSFNMVDGFTTVGKNIRVKCQTMPGVVRTLY